MRLFRFFRAVCRRASLYADVMERTSRNPLGMRRQTMATPPPIELVNKLCANPGISATTQCHRHLQSRPSCETQKWPTHK